MIPGKYLLFLGDADERLYAKTACGLIDWAPERCVGQWRLPTCGIDLGLPDMNFADAIKAGAKTLVIGITPFGGAIAPAWIGPIAAALHAGLNVASGMHMRLEAIPEIAAAAQGAGVSLFNIRVPVQSYPVGTGRKRTGRRMLMVGTDCAVGKKYSALAITRDMNSAGLKASFRATGQTGILIAGAGVPIDAIVSDFVAGAAEALSPDNDSDHWDVIEGQGSLFHPAYAGVALGLLHGSQPDAIILCHAAGRTHVDGYPDYPLPDISACIDMNLDLAARTNPEVRCAGISINTSALPENAREPYLASLQAEFGLPCFDPLATGAHALVEYLGQNLHPAKI
ncbi:N-acetyltransferase DgcN [Sphingopyxis sp. JAI128]|uniref:N-acetyltransferase DgcN n=1 Tax=Sphingopyxis sp. JAI128 TaxID=2723066 RepID=UPI001615940C|nr:N-acetyltransferase DgcN [Sphingopyxis sp. JAI128]MBB6428156.1 putative NAD-dependent epimerase/dehydratase family protein [Sphingopyxis sp. JAI128]